MAKVYCARAECKYNNKNTCKAKEINLRAWHINTVNEGFKQMEECRTFEMSEEAKKIKELINKQMGCAKMTHELKIYPQYFKAERNGEND